MRISLFLLLALWVPLGGCTGMLQDHAIIRVAQMAPSTVSGEIFAGCYAYHADHDRWPRTLVEIEEGLSVARRENLHLRTIQDLTLAPDEADLIVSYRQSGSLTVSMHLTPPVLGEPPSQ